MRKDCKSNSSNNKRGAKRSNKRVDSKIRAGKQQDELREDKGYKDDYTNDPEWYARSPELMRLAASIPFSNAAGVSFDMDFNSTGDATYTGQRITIPGLMVANVIPCPHVDPYANDPLNIAANSMLSYVVHANSRNLSYNAPDLMIYNIAMGNIYAYINFLMRIYGTSQLFSTFNRNLPNMVITAQGVNYGDLMSHLADFRYGINVLINKAASFSAPADMPYFRRLAFLFSGIYAEGESIKSQLYMYVPAGFMQYAETAQQTGGSLTFKVFNNLEPKTVDQLLAYGNELLNAIIGSEDMGVISGDILKAYGADGLLKLATLPEIYTVTPVTDLNVLEQFQNMTWINTSYSDMTVQITQSQKNTQGPVLVGGVSLKTASQWLEAATNNFILTTILTDPQPADVMERTRLMCGVMSLGTNAETFYATEIVKQVQMWKMNGGTPNSSLVPFVQGIAQTMTQAQIKEMVQTHCDLETFKFHPRVNYNTTTSATAFEFFGFALDTDNYAVFNYATLERMNSAAIMSLFMTHVINLIQ